MKIAKIIARYESHAGTVIEPSNSLTGIIADNDTGKSGLNRSIKWVSTNSPRGDEMIPWTGKKEASVEIITDKGDSVIRVKGTENKYIVNGQTFKALGAAVPEEVTDVLNLDDTNIQAQVNQYFVLQSSPGEVAKRINAAAGIEDSDQAIKRTNELIGESTKEIKGLKAEIKEHKDYLTEHGPVIDAAAHALECIELQSQDLVTDQVALAEATVFSADYKQVQEAVAGFPDFEKISNRLEAIDGLEGTVEKQTDFCRRAADLALQLHSLDRARFDVLDEIDFSRMQVLAGQIKEQENRQSGAIELRRQIAETDLERYAVLTGAAPLIVRMQGREKEIEEIEAALAGAVTVSAELHKCDLARFAVLDELDLTGMSGLESSIVATEAKLSLLRQAAGSMGQVRAAEAELEALYKEIEEAGALCGSCGQIIGG